MDEFERSRRLDLQRQAEAEGRVVDSLSARLGIVERIHRGEITLAEGQAELKRLQRGAKAAGKITRHQAWLGR